MRHHVNEDWAVCPGPAFVSRLAFLSAGSPHHYTSENVHSTQQRWPLAQAALPSGFYRGNLDTAWGCQNRLIQPSELCCSCQLCSHGLLASMSLPGNRPHCREDPSQQSFLSQKSITSDAVAFCWLAPASLLAPSICKVDITHTGPIPAWEKGLKRRETLGKEIYSSSQPKGWNKKIIICPSLGQKSNSIGWSDLSPIQLFALCKYSLWAVKFSFYKVNSLWFLSPPLRDNWELA